MLFNFTEGPKIHPTCFCMQLQWRSPDPPNFILNVTSLRAGGAFFSFVVESLITSKMREWSGISWTLKSSVRFARWKSFRFLPAFFWAPLSFRLLRVETLCHQSQPKQLIYFIFALIDWRIYDQTEPRQPRKKSECNFLSARELAYTHLRQDVPTRPLHMLYLNSSILKIFPSKIFFCVWYSTRCGLFLSRAHQTFSRLAHFHLRGISRTWYMLPNDTAQRLAKWSGG